MTVRLAFLLLSLWPLFATAERVSYELYELSANDGRKLLVKGTKEYSPGEVIVEEFADGTQRRWTKELAISKGFAIGASVYREKRLDGFGLWLKSREGFLAELNRGGFSWEWFDRESGNVYRKRQGLGRVKVTLVPSTSYEEISSIEFLDDVILRLNNSLLLSSDRDTHHIVIAAGSILRFAP
jgi:hypothetical protein